MNRSQECGPQIPSAEGNDAFRERFSRERLDDMHGRGSHAPSRTVLFVDDEPDILAVRRLMFEFMGYSVFTAQSGDEALELLRLNAVDAVVVDYIMPDMDGEETARRIRKMRPHVPIVLSSGCLSVPQRVLDAVNASVNKGVRQEMLFDVLEQQLALLSTARGAHDIAVQLGNPSSA